MVYCDNTLDNLLAYRGFPLITRVDRNSFNVEGRGVNPRSRRFRSILT